MLKFRVKEVQKLEIWHSEKEGKNMKERGPERWQEFMGLVL